MRRTTRGGLLAPGNHDEWTADFHVGCAETPAGARSGIYRQTHAPPTRQAACRFAVVLGIAPSTVKTQLLRVFGKTGCSRQAELVKLAASISLPV